MMFLHLKQKDGLIPAPELTGKGTVWVLLTLLKPSVNSPVVLVMKKHLLLFFTFIDYPFALCVNCNTWEGISMMRENQIFEQCSCQTKSQQAHRAQLFQGIQTSPKLIIFLPQNTLSEKIPKE